MTDETYTEVVAQVDFEFSSHPDEKEKKTEHKESD